jgi:hypothetical protein
MAAATTIIGGVALAAAAAQTTKGIIDTSKANKALNNYERQDLVNSYEDMAVSTEGAELMREESARTTNSLISAVAKGGSRAITANVGRIAATNVEGNRIAAYELDRKLDDKNQMIASENARIQSMYENREIMDLQGIGAQLEAGKQTTWNGLSAMQNSVGYMANNGAFDAKPRQSVVSSSTIKPKSLVATAAPQQPIKATLLT